MITKSKNSDIEPLADQLFQPLGLSITEIKAAQESSDYDAHTITVNSHIIIYRKAKVTPKKVGQFVTTWKRNTKHVTVPYDIKDDFSCFLILVKLASKVGVFVFPKSILQMHHVISDEAIDGKRGFRVYPSWDVPSSKQALSSQKWQSQFFIDLSQTRDLNVNSLRSLLNYIL